MRKLLSDTTVVEIRLKNTTRTTPRCSFQPAYLMDTSFVLRHAPIAFCAIISVFTGGCESGPSHFEQMSNPRSEYYTRGWDGSRDRGYAGDSRASNPAVIHQDVLNATNSSNSRLEVDLGDQKVRLYRVSGGQRELALETAISTGREGHHTPVGEFSVLEKLREKKSTLYGSWVDAGSGALLQGDGDSRNRPSGGQRPEFQGAPMPYWLRITNDGVGMHVGYVPNYPASHGCIRVSRKIQPMIYERVKVGTPVTIRH